jgi:hypothetical protein
MSRFVFLGDTGETVNAKRKIGEFVVDTPTVKPVTICTMYERGMRWIGMKERWMFVEKR